VHTIAVTGVNDVFVMEAWKKSTGAEGKIDFLADGNGEFAKAIDMAFDGSGNGLGTRSKRYSMLVDDGVVKKLNIEDAPGKAIVRWPGVAWPALNFSSRFGMAGNFPAISFTKDYFVFIAPIAPARGDNAFTRKLIGSLVHGMTGMAFDPVPVHLVMAGA
jgi:hypothetical protein